MSLFSFGKSEKLKHLKDINILFQEGRAFNIHPLRVVFMPTLSGEVRILISVPKRKFKQAVTRNRIKRQIREAYRLNRKVMLSAPELKNQIKSDSSNGLNIGFVYIGDKADISYNEINNAMISVLERLSLH